MPLGRRQQRFEAAAGEGFAIGRGHREQPDPQHSGARAPGSDDVLDIGGEGVDAADHAEARRMGSRGGLPVAVVVTVDGGHHDHRGVDPGLVHLRQQEFVRHQVRRRADSDRRLAIIAPTVPAIPGKERAVGRHGVYLSVDDLEIGHLRVDHMDGPQKRRE
jgi:hypothetical protein